MTSSQQSRIPAVSCQKVWKVFGGASTVKRILNPLIQKEMSAEEAWKEHGCVVAVNDATFEVFPSEVFCIMGLSGSGKSTLIRHINRLIEPSAGEISIEGDAISSLSSKALRELRASKVGMVFQNVALLPHRTVAENTRLALELRGAPAENSARVVRDALSIVGLSGWEDRYPNELSGGMQQRVGLARSLAAAVDILLMDEPFSALDPLIRKQLQDEFRRLVKTLGKTALFITHDLEEAIRIGDRIAIMQHGRIVQIGTPEDIVLTPASDYVAQFVEGISPVKFIKASRIMTPVTSYFGNAPVGTLPSGWAKAAPDASLNTLIDLQTATNQPVAIMQDGTLVGVVGAKEMLDSIQPKKTHKGGQSQ
jgi:glycine betaine/proline transport system ATP-binding protein